MNKKLMLAGVVCCSAFMLNAQQNADYSDSDWYLGTGESHRVEKKMESSFYFGLGGGYHSSSMSFSNLDKSIFPNCKNQGSGLFNLFLQYEFGQKKQFGLRLEIDFLKRGGLLDNIYNTEDFINFYDSEGLKDVHYKLRSNYTDIRLPLIYQFLNSRSTLRPYVYLAPIVCFSSGGYINAQNNFVDATYYGSHLSITNGNMRSTYLAGSVGAGLKYDLNLYNHPFYLSMEVNYQMGFTDTYSSKEKSGSAAVKDNIFHTAYDVTGNRRFNGWEIKGSISIPFSIFSKKKSVTVIESYPISSEFKEEVQEVINEDVIKDIPPCRSIDEIFSMIKKGEDIHGITFCSIADIHFETGKSTLLPTSNNYLTKLASILKQTGVSIEIMGHTDNVGTPDFNIKLSKARALAVSNYLKKLGVPKNQLSISYYGDSRPIRDNSTEYGRSVNRRVEFEIK